MPKLTIPSTKDPTAKYGNPKKKKYPLPDRIKLVVKSTKVHANKTLRGTRL